MLPKDTKDYSIFTRFIEKYLSQGFANINSSDSLILELEQFTQINNQFFFVADLFAGQIIFASQRSIDMVGVAPESLNPSHIITQVHPDDLHRITKGWATLLNQAHGLMANKYNASLLSINMRLKNHHGSYSETLFQAYQFLGGSPNRKVFDLQIHTNIDWFKFYKSKYHYYAGSELLNFRYPDQDLLSLGINLSKREFEIVNHILQGESSEQIANKLFLSLNTVNTHRRNILKKFKKQHFSELIYDLQKQGVL